MMTWMAELIRRLLHGDEVHLARLSQARMESQRRREDLAGRVAFLEAMRTSGAPTDRMVLGRAPDLESRWHWCGMPEREFSEGHTLLTGATGSGKSRELAA